MTDRRAQIENIEREASLRRTAPYFVPDSWVFERGSKTTAYVKNEAGGYRIVYGDDVTDEIRADSSFVTVSVPQTILDRVQEAYDYIERCISSERKP